MNEKEVEKGIKSEGIGKLMEEEGNEKISEGNIFSWNLSSKIVKLIT